MESESVAFFAASNGQNPARLVKMNGEYSSTTQVSMKNVSNVRTMSISNEVGETTKNKSVPQRHCFLLRCCRILTQRVGLAGRAQKFAQKWWQWDRLLPRTSKSFSQQHVQIGLSLVHCGFGSFLGFGITASPACRMSARMSQHWLLCGLDLQLNL